MSFRLLAPLLCLTLFTMLNACGTENESQTADVQSSHDALRIGASPRPIPDGGVCCDNPTPNCICIPLTPITWLP